MRNIKWIAMALALIMVLSACGGGSDKITLYSHNTQEEMQEFVDALKEETGIEAEFLAMSSEEIWSRISAEYPDVGAEAQWGMLHSLAYLADEEDMLEPYLSPEWEDVPEQFKDPDGKWYGWSFWFNILAVNVDLLDELGLDKPTSWADLIDPQYKGEIVMPDPGNSGTGFLIVSTLIQIMGEDEAWAYFEELDKNVSQYTQSGSQPAQMAGLGEYAISITWDQAAFDRIEGGFPLEAIVPEEGVGFDLDVAWIYKDTKNMEQAKKVIDFIGSEKGMQAAATQRSMVTKPGVAGTIDFEPNLIEYDAIWAAENRTRIMDKWNATFNK